MDATTARDYFVSQCENFEHKYVSSFLKLFSYRPFRSNLTWFYIYDAVLSRQHQITPEAAIGRWESELSYLSKYAHIARNKFSNINDQSVYFATHCLYYLMYGDPDS